HQTNVRWPGACPRPSAFQRDCSGLRERGISAAQSNSGGETMRSKRLKSKHLGLLAGAGIGAIILAGGASAQTLTGQVSSAPDGAMEGVLVSLKKEGSTITTTVVSNDKGTYSVPAGRLQPGKHTITIR